MTEVVADLNCPDCGRPMLDKGNGTWWCTPCMRARDPNHMEPYVEPPKTVKAKFKRVKDVEPVTSSDVREARMAVMSPYGDWRTEDDV